MYKTTSPPRGYIKIIKIMNLCSNKTYYKNLLIIKFVLKSVFKILVSSHWSVLFVTNIVNFLNPDKMKVVRV